MKELNENSFIQVLESSVVAEKNYLAIIAERLSLQMFYETQPGVFFTIGSRLFVIDIYSEHIKLYFVDEELQTKLSYIEDYMNYYFEKRNYKALYFVIFYLVKSEENQKNDCRLTCKGTICDCIFTNNPGLFYSFDELRKMENYNIFTHKKNALIFTPKITIQSWKKYKPEFLEISMKGENIKIDSLGNAYVDNKRNSVLSYMFHKGLDIELCYDLYREVQPKSD